MISAAAYIAERDFGHDNAIAWIEAYVRKLRKEPDWSKLN
jgi:hypothetical protein